MMDSPDKHHIEFSDLLPEIVFEVDKTLRIKYLNDACAEVLGKPKNELLNTRMPIEGFFSPSDLDKIKHSIRENFSGHLVSGNHYTIADHKGNERIFSVHNNHIKKDGEVIALRCIAIDITSKEKNHKEVSSQAEHYHHIFMNSPIAYQALDKDGNFLDVNPMWEKTTGYSRNEIIGKNFKTIVADADLEKQQKNFQQFKKTGEINDVQLNIKTKRNRTIIVNYNGKIERNKNGDFIKTHCVFSDITLQKKAEQTLIDSEIKLRDLNATKDKFFSIIAHDLKNPFNDIMGFTQLLSLNMHKYDKFKIEKFIEIIHHSSKLAYNLLENLLDWSRSQTGTLEFRPEKFILNEIIDENIELLLSTAQNKNISIYSEVAPHIFVYADKNMVRTIIRNLISNAIKYTRLDGFIRITNYYDKNSCEISVVDNGIGIPPKNIDKIFRIDESFSTSGTENEKGTGLGLILCKEFVEKNGGKIWVESSENEGSTFSFTLPVPEPDFIQNL